MKEQKDLAKALNEELKQLSMEEGRKQQVLRMHADFCNRRMRRWALVPAAACIVVALVLVLLFYNPHQDQTDRQPPVHLQEGTDHFTPLPVENWEKGCLVGLYGAEMQGMKMQLKYNMGYVKGSLPDDDGDMLLITILYNTNDRIAPSDRRLWLDEFMPDWRTWLDGDAARIMGSLTPLMKLEGVVETWTVSINDADEMYTWLLEESWISQDGEVTAVYAPADASAPLPEKGMSIHLRPESMRLGGWIKHDSGVPLTFEILHECKKTTLYHWQF